MASRLIGISPTDLLHCIRAKRREFHRGANASDDAAERAARLLAEQLKWAMAMESPVDIAVVLGCAAEMLMFPPTAVLDACTSAIQLAEQPALRGVVWAVRHRQSRAPSGARTLLL